MSDFILRALTIILSIVSVRGVIAVIKKAPEPKERIVFLPRLLAIIGLVCAVLFLIPTVICVVLKEALWVILGFMLFVFLGLSLVVAHINCRITYNDEGFTVKSFWGIKRTYSYSDITAICGHKEDVKLFIGKHKVNIDTLAAGKYEFISFAKKQYRKAHNGAAVPTVSPKPDIFNDNIEGAAGMLVMYVILFVVMLGFVMWLLFAYPIMPEDGLAYKTVTVESYDFAEENIELYAEGGRYHISYYEDALDDYTVLTRLFDTKPSLELGVNKSADKASDSLRVYSIKDSEGNVYLTSDNAVAGDIRTRSILCLIFGGFAVLWAIYALVSIYVGRNIQKFSRRTVRFFFKPSHVRCNKR